jgi:LysM repeat protein
MMTNKIFFLLSLFIFVSIAVFAQDDNLLEDEVFIKTLDSSIVDNPLYTGDEACMKIDSIVNFAVSHIGARYKYACEGPYSFDCSGLMFYTFKNFGITLGRSSRDQYRMGIKVSKNDIRKGDLVFFLRGKKGHRYIGHVGLVIEVDSTHNFKFVHASNPQYGIRIDESTRSGYIGSFAGARRIIQCDGENRPYILPNKPFKDITVFVADSTSKDTIAVAAKAISEKQVVQPKAIYYKVKKGDTLSSISRKYHVSVANIKKWNRLRSDLIKIDQRLKIYK